MELWEAIKGRRSIRRFRNEAIAEEVIVGLLEAASWAPSWANTQCWEVILVSRAGLKEALAETLTPRNPATEAVRKAPWVAVFLGQRGRSGYYRGRPITEKGDWLMFDVALAVQNFCLAAHDRGLGTVIVGAFDSKKAALVLGVPEDREVVVLVPVGVPLEVPSPPKRKEIPSFLHRETFGPER